MMTLSILVAALMFVSWPVVAACAYLYRIRGSGDAKFNWIPQKKTVTILAIGLVAAVPLAIRGFYEYGANWTVIGSALGLFLISVQLLLRPSWGELFPHTGDTYMKGFSFGVRPVTDGLTGYAYDPRTAKDDVREVFWKMSGWIARFGIYGLPMAICVAVLCKAPLAIPMWIFACLWIGWLYLRAFLNDTPQTDEIAEAEKDTGFLFGFYITAAAFG